MVEFGIVGPRGGDDDVSATASMDPQPARDTPPASRARGARPRRRTSRSGRTASGARPEGGSPPASAGPPHRVTRLLNRGLLSQRAIVAVATLLTVVPVAVLVTVVPGLAADSAVDDARRRTASAATTSARYLDEHLAGLAGLVASFAGRPSVVRALGDGDPARGDPVAMREELAALHRARPDVAVVSVVDGDGLLLDILPPTPGIVGKSFAFRDWYRGVVETGRAYVSEVFTGAATGTPVATALAAPVVGTSRNRIAVIVAAYDVNAVQAFVEEIAADQGVLLTVADQRGRVAARPDRRSPSLSGAEEQLIAGVTRAASVHAADVRGADGGDYLAAAAAAPRTGWSVLAEIDRADALAGARRLRGAVSGLAAVLGLAFVGGVLLLLALLRERRLASADLRAANGRAMEASRVKSEFLANMSHEIRTPMNGVIGMTDVLLATPLSRQQREYADAIRSSGELLLGIINDILDLSKIEAGRMALDDAELDVVTTVEEAVAAHAPAAQAKGLEIAVTIDPAAPRVIRGDALRFRQVLTNLVGNAVKFTADGEVLVRASAGESASPRPTLRIEVCDTGIGVSEEARRRLFRSFSQGEASTTREYGGTGLGLAISKQLVDMMGGEIGVESTPGQGSTFWFTVPCRVPADPPRESRGTGHLVGQRVLVVDDNATNRAILEAGVRAWGMRPTTAEGGAEALALLRAAAREGDPFTVVLLDHQMPGMSGLDVARAVAADAALAGTPLALLTSMAFEGDAVAARRAGVAAFLTKPVRQSVLYDRLVEMVSGPRPAPATATDPDVAPTRAAEPGGVVLVAEDNEVNQRVATAMLDSLGFRTELAATGEEAVRKVGEREYLAVLMDCQMPVMDGYDAARAIRAREALGGRRVPIIAMTANAMNGDEERCLAAGMDGYLTKPVTAAKLAATLQPFGAEPAVGAPPDRSTGDGAVLDEGMIAELRSFSRRGQASRMNELVETFLATADERLVEVSAALDRRDPAAAAAVAHGLKGSSANLGATAVADLCADLEASARDGFARDDVLAVLASLRRELTRAGTALRAEFPPVTSVVDAPPPAVPG